jgi:hypothetical protein
MTDHGAPDLAGLCVELAGELDEVTSSAEDGGTTFRRAGTPFARASGSVLDVRLPEDIADAAARTTDTVELDEPGWVRFAPDSSERHVVDRATAWFETGWRHAGGG